LLFGKNGISIAISLETDLCFTFSSTALHHNFLTLSSIKRFSAVVINMLLLSTTLLFALASGSPPIYPRHESITFEESITVEANGMANIHIDYNIPLSGEFSIHYGSCESSTTFSKQTHHHQVGETMIGDHPLAKRNSQWQDSRPKRFVWLVPQDAADGGCLFGYSGTELVGKSERVSVMKRRNKRGIVIGDIADAEGPWFDGVAYLKDKEPESVFVAQAKSKKIGILGGGMSGLMSSVSVVSIVCPSLITNLGIHSCC